MSQPLRFIPLPTVRKLFRLPSIMVNHAAAWNAFNAMATGNRLTPQNERDLWEFYLCISILVIGKCYPDKPVNYHSGMGVLQNQNQIDELMVVLENLEKYYRAQPHQRVMKAFPQCPTTVSQQKRFYAHFRKKGLKLWLDEFRRLQNEPLRKVIERANSSVTLPKNNYHGGLDEYEVNSDDEVVEFDPDEKIMYERMLTACRTDDFVVLENLRSPFHANLEQAFGRAIERSAIVEYLNQITDRDLLQVVFPATLIESDYSVVEVEAHDSAVDIVLAGPTPFSFDSQDTDAGRSSKSGKIGILTKRAKTLDSSLSHKLKEEITSKALDEVILIGFGMEITEDVREVLDDRIQVWDLLDMARYLQQKFHSLPKPAQDRVTKLLDELTKDF